MIVGNKVTTTLTICQAVTRDYKTELELNPLTHYISCVGHSLQLVGSAAAGSNRNSIEFFALEKQLYNIFHSSTKIWDILLSRYDKDSQR